MNYIKTYLTTLAIFLSVDAVWLIFIAKNFYAKHLGYLMKSDVNFIAAGLFYLLFIFGLVILAIQPALKEQSWTKALLLGALLGLVSYGTYDLTNLATIKDWPLIVTIVDLIWGSFLGGSVGTISYFILK
jgi:uncharacterized membrane protein